MLTKEEKFQIAWKIFEKLAPQSRPRNKSNEPNKYSLEAVGLPYESITEPEPDTIHHLPTLREIVNKLKPLPPFSAVVGICEDGLPFLFDLSDPTPGSVLISGDDSTGKTHLLKTILGSASALNHPGTVKYTLITPNSGIFSDFTSRTHCTETISTYERASSERIINLVNIAEQRKSGRHTGPALILAIDDLGALLSYNEFEVYSHLRWLVKHGPDSLIWPIAILRPGNLNSQSKRVVNEFRTQLIGRQASTYLPPSSDQYHNGSSGNGHFETYMENQWVRFWTLDVD